jgi:hypothetical protein
MSGSIRKRTILVTRVAGAAALSVALLTSWPSSPARAAAPPQSSLVSGFMDHTSHDYLRVQLDSSAADYGQFVVALWPTRRCAMR